MPLRIEHDGTRHPATSLDERLALVAQDDLGRESKRNAPTRTSASAATRPGFTSCQIAGFFGLHPTTTGRIVGQSLPPFGP